MSMNWFLIQRALITWAITKSHVNAVIFQMQDAPRPKLPFIDMDIGSITKPIEDMVSLPNEKGHRVISGTREFQVNVRYFGSWNATGELDDLLITLNMADVRARFEKVGLIILRTNPILDTTFLEEHNWCSRAETEILCRTAISLPYGGDSPETQTLEQVTIQGIYKPGDLEQTIIVPQ